MDDDKNGRWGPWRGLPCDDNQTALAACCPHGWIEFIRERIAGEECWRHWAETGEEAC